jgi:hypothetical protein
MIVKIIFNSIITALLFALAWIIGRSLFASYTVAIITAYIIVVADIFLCVDMYVSEAEQRRLYYSENPETIDTFESTRIGYIMGAALWLVALLFCTYLYVDAYKIFR